MLNTSNKDATPITTPQPMIPGLPTPAIPVNIAQPTAGNSKSQEAAADTRVHLWIQKRTGRKRLTFIQGIPESVDWAELAQKLRKQFHCNCTEIEHPKIGKCIQLSGDFREDLKQLFVKDKIVRSKKQVKVHGD